MPWQLSSDLRRFKRITMGGTLIMGRKTFDSIGRPLPGRRTVVLTRDPAWRAEGVDVFTDCAAAEASLGPDQPAFVVGGAEIYQLWLPRCDRILLTRVWSQTAGDTALELPLSDFRLVMQQRWPQAARDSVPTEFEVWRRSGDGEVKISNSFHHRGPRPVQPS